MVVMAWLTKAELTWWTESEKLLMRVIAVAPSEQQAWRACHSLGVYYAHVNRGEEARRCLLRAQAVNFDPRTLLKLGFIEYSQRRIPQAKWIFGSLLREGAFGAEACTALGYMAKNDGSWAEAARWFAQALTYDNSNVPAIAELAMVCAAAPDPALRDGPRALDLAQRAMRLTGGTELRSITAAAAAHAEIGEFAEAENLALKALVGAARLGDSPEVALCEQRLAAYRAKQPWRDHGPRSKEPRE
jgi:tetratricopeptide (TPR) repeat protein